MFGCHRNALTRRQMQHQNVEDDTYDHLLLVYFKRRNSLPTVARAEAELQARGIPLQPGTISVTGYLFPCIAIDT